MRENPQMAKSQIGLQKLLDILRNYYPFSDVAPSDVFNALGSRTKLSQWEVRELRSILLGAIEKLLSDSLELEEVSLNKYMKKEISELI